MNLYKNINMLNINNIKIAVMALGYVGLPLAVSFGKKYPVNISGFLNTLTAARDVEVRSFTYAASSYTYGNHSSLPKVEDKIRKPLSPYAITKYVNELYADVFARS